MGLLTLGRLEPTGTEALIRALAERHITTGPSAGSFVLRQGPTVGRTDEHWTPPMHPDGAALHACHVADLLLDVPANQPEGRRRAEPLLAGIRDFLRRSLAEPGRLLDPEGNTSQRTLYGFALCPALSLPLPAGWRDAAADVLTAATGPGASMENRCFAVMNCTYLHAALHAATDAAFAELARTYVAEQLPHLTAPELLGSEDAVAVSLALRAVAYGAELMDPRLGGYVRRAAQSAQDQSGTAGW